jgi:hypothetical protein
MTVTCYEGIHLPLAILVWFLLMFYTVGFPFICLATLRHGNGQKFRRNISFVAKHAITQWDFVNAGAKENIADLRRSESMGFLVDDLKPSMYWFNCVQFPCNWVVAAVTVS